MKLCIDPGLACFICALTFHMNSCPIWNKLIIQLRAVHTRLRIHIDTAIRRFYDHIVVGLIIYLLCLSCICKNHCGHAEGKNHSQQHSQLFLHIYPLFPVIYFFMSFFIVPHNQKDATIFLIFFQSFFQYKRLSMRFFPYTAKEQDPKSCSFVSFFLNLFGGMKEGSYKKLIIYKEGHSSCKL